MDARKNANRMDACSYMPRIEKKGYKLKCNNYRRISLLDIVYKMLAVIIGERIKPYAEEVWGEYQSGFSSGRSTICLLYTSRCV